ncbi:hypothetical protein DFH28DRAFT_351545 [Melampsora americana]|nr:hypothetical protein DFH28DRAFT_351545 [Melampsora americana]
MILACTYIHVYDMYSFCILLVQPIFSLVYLLIDNSPLFVPLLSLLRSTLNNIHLHPSLIDHSNSLTAFILILNLNRLSNHFLIKSHPFNPPLASIDDTLLLQRASYSSSS